MKLKTLFIIILILVLIAIIGGETYYIIQNNNAVTQLSTEANDLKRSLAEVKNTINTKEKEKQNLVAEQEAGKEASNKTTEEKKKEETTNNKTSMESMTGSYKAKIDFTDDTNPGKKTEETVTIELILSSDGTYQYEYGYWASAGEYGNWFIDNNGDIVLNRVFCHSSDAALRLNRDSKKRTLKIKDEKTLQDTSNLFEVTKALSDKDIILRKESNKTDFSLYNKIKDYRNLEGERLTIFGE